MPAVRSSKLVMVPILLAQFFLEEALTVVQEVPVPGRLVLIYH